MKIKRYFALLMFFGAIFIFTNLNSTSLGCIGFCPGVSNNGLCLFSEASGKICQPASNEEIVLGYLNGKLPCNVEASNANTCPPN